MITELTAEEEKAKVAYLEEWMAVGYDTNTINRMEAATCINWLYSLLGRQPPQLIFVNSEEEVRPLAAAELMKFNAKQSGTKAKKPTKADEDTVWAGRINWNWWWLSYYAWLGFAPLHIKKFKLDKEHRDKLNGVLKCCKQLHILLPFEDVCFVVEKPNLIKVDDQKRLHNETGPALEYRDGFQKHAWHGVKVPKLVIENPEQITLKMIDGESNAEVRRVMMEKYGWGRYLIDSGAKIIDSYVDQLGFPVNLYKKDLGTEFAEPVVMIELTNSTIEGIYTPSGQFIPALNEKGEQYHKKYMFCVPPNITSAKEGHAWHIGLDDVKEVRFAEQT